jgi:hypothetical protein
MEDKQIARVGRPPRRIRTFLLDVVQVVVVAFIGLLLLIGVSTSSHMLSAPDAPMLLFWGMISAGILLGLAHTPYAFHRWGDAIKAMAYVLLLLFMPFWFWTLNEVAVAWDKTPAGAAEAKQIAQGEQIEQAQERQEREFEAAEREQDAARAQEAAARARLEHCFTYIGHHLPVLETVVRDSLHNPRSFEHVKTEVTDPRSAGYNVTMTFRAQNGFGAIRTLTVGARIDPNTCSVTDIQDQPQEA